MFRPIINSAGLARRLLTLAMVVLLAVSGVLHMAAGDHSVQGHGGAHGDAQTVSLIGDSHGCEGDEHAVDEQDAPCVASVCPLCVPASAVLSADTAVEHLVRDNAVTPGPASRLARLYRPPRTLAT